jgi:hypothetical protein
MVRPRISSKTVGFHLTLELPMEAAVYVNSALAVVVALGWLVELSVHSKGESLYEALAISVKWSR